MTETYNPCVWAMQYVEVLEKRSSTDPQESAFFNTYGFDKLTKPASTDAPYLNARWATLVTRFNERYQFRRIGQETMPRWQIRLQNKFDEFVDEMERAYRLYATTTQIDEVIAGTKTTYASGVSHTGTDSNTGSSDQKAIATPDSEVNDDEDYADSLVKATSSNTTSHNTSDSRSGNDRVEVLGPEVLAGINKSITSWIDIDTFFISQFENNFLNIW